MPARFRLASGRASQFSKEVRQWRSEVIFQRLNRMYSVSYAAKKLGVTTRAIQRACHRWSVGSKMSVGTQGKIIFMLSAQDISFLDEHLQRRPGKPSNGKKQFDSDVRQKK